MFRLFTGILLTVCFFSAFRPGPAGAQEANWPRFHGPQGAGTASGPEIPSAWTDADYLWKTPLPGVGHGSPVVWGDRLFVVSGDDPAQTPIDRPDVARRLLCLSTDTGKILWERTFHGAGQTLHLRNSYGSTTPAVDAERVYFPWADPQHLVFAAFDHEGNLLWQRELGPFVNEHGFSISPILCGELVILPLFQQAEDLAEGQTPGQSCVVALDRRTGRTAWRCEQPSTVVSYSTPLIYRGADGRDQLIFCAKKPGMFALEPQTGQTLWSIPVFEMRTVSSPLEAGGLLFGSNGSGGGGNYLVAVRPGPEPQEEYRFKKSAPYVPTSVAKGDLLFLCGDRGVASCIDAPTGKIHWQERLGGDFSASPIRIDDRIFCVSDEGEVVVLEASTTFRLLGRTQLGEPTRATPAAAGGRLFLRTYGHVMAVGRKG